MTAIEYYYELLRENGYSPRQAISDAQRAIWLQLLKKRSPEMSEEKISELVNECAEILDSGKHFDPLIEDIINHIPKDVKKRLPPGFVGEFPINDLNGMSMMTPSKEYLILINRGLTVALQQWAKLIVSIFVTRLGFERSPDVNSHVENVATVMRYSLLAYIQRKEIPSFPVYVEEPAATLITVLGMSASRFVLAHEYAHILLGHLGQDPASTESQIQSKPTRGWLKSVWNRLMTQPDFDFLPEPAILSSTRHIELHYARRSWQQELSADAFALELLFTDMDESPLSSLTLNDNRSQPQPGKRLFDIEITLAGIGFLFGLHHLMDRLRLPEIVQTHPPMHVRWNGISSFLDTRLNMNQYGLANTIGGIMNEMASHISN